MDKLKFFLGIALAIVMVFFAASVYSQFARSTPVPSGERETLYQVSTIDALMQGVYDGIQPISEVKKHGDFGIGTFDALDGEMIVLDGVVYQVKADGRVYEPPDNLTTPFAAVTYFDRDYTVTTTIPMNFTAFAKVMTKQLPSQNMMYAVRIRGTFPSITVRSEPPQEKPYPNLTVALQNQSVYSYTHVSGSVVGFYTPALLEGLNVVGYHLHFISDNRQTGGHVLDFIVPVNTSVEYDITPEFDMILPMNGSFTGVDLSQDLSKELAKLEN